MVLAQIYIYIYNGYVHADNLLRKFLLHILILNDSLQIISQVKSPISKVYKNNARKHIEYHNNIGGIIIIIRVKPEILVPGVQNRKGSI